MTDERAKAKQRTEARRAYFAFLDKRIPELHEQGKPPPDYDDQGRIIAGRSGDFPGRTARNQADLEWAQRAAV